METQQETTTPAIEEAVSTASEAVDTSEASADAAPVVDPAAAPEVAYAPDFKYKFDGQDKELDPFWRPLVKDKETNQKVLDAVQQLDAFPKWKQLATEAEETVGTVKQLSELFQKGDHERVMEALGYTDEMIYEIARQKLERTKLPPEQRAQFEEKRQLQLANEKLQLDNQKYQSEAQRELSRVTEYEMDMELGKAEYQKVVQAYDAHNGSGGFKRLVAQKGDQMVRSLGRHVKPAELMKEVMREYTPFLNQTPAPQVAAPKVIPTLTGGSGSPGKRAVTSIDDIRKRRAELVASGDE